MSARPGARVALLLTVFVAAATLLPVVEADHAYSHRYVVFGRVVDAAGDPVPGVTVDAGFRGVDMNPAVDRCADQPNIDTEALGPTRTRPVTDEAGMFIYCVHHHALSRVDPGSVVLRIQEYDLDEEIRLDPFRRVTFTTLELPVTHPRANTQLAESSYLVLGRAWEPVSGQTSVEGITVYGETLDFRAVNITVALPDGTEVNASTTTNGYGDFAVFVPVPQRVTGGQVTVHVDRLSAQTQEIEDADGMSTFAIDGPKRTDPAIRNGLMILGGLVAVAAIVGGGWYGYRRVSEKREAQRVRRTSTRKRANK